MVELMPHQQKALHQLDSGKILWGGVGSGKSLTALAWYVQTQSPKDIYVITTPKKRDSLDWVGEAARLCIGTTSETSYHGVLTVDSWNNVGKYVETHDAVFIFDEQRVVGYGAWVKAFIKIAKKNSWLLLSATPGDTWMDYVPVFIANGFYRNKTEFVEDHVIYAPFNKYPKIRGYIGERKLETLRNEILVEMPYLKHTERIINYMECGYDKETFSRVWDKRWNVYQERPIFDVAELFRVSRRVLGTDPSRLDLVRRLIDVHPKLIIFYNFNYELEVLRTLSDEIEVGEWNGHRKDPVPQGERWLYLVQYVAGAEGWNCTSTDAMILWSLTYSWKNFEQALGRIDRLDTPFKKLYYYILVSNSTPDRAVRRSLSMKQDFNERKFVRELEKNGGNPIEFGACTDGFSEFDTAVEI